MKAIALIILVANSTCPAAYAADNHSLRGLNFLLGEWQADPPTQGGDVFRRDLDGKIIIRVAQTAGNGTTAITMKMAMTIYSELGDGLHAIYFDNQGHVIHYSAGDIVPGRSVQFLSDSISAAPRFRLTYSIRGKDELAVRFEMAAPAVHSEYKIIAEGFEHRVTP